MVKMTPVEAAATAPLTEGLSQNEQEPSAVGSTKAGPGAGGASFAASPLPPQKTDSAADVVNGPKSDPKRKKRRLDPKHKLLTD